MYGVLKPARITAAICSRIHHAPALLSLFPLPHTPQKVLIILHTPVTNNVCMTENVFMTPAVAPLPHPAPLDIECSV